MRIKIPRLILISWMAIMLQTTMGQPHYPNWDFHFPLNIDAVVSGSFGELRGSHFHSGVDFTTHGKTGLPVYAIDDGYVFRIAVSPVGFGKAVYINHPNGYTSVYAHLEWFSEKIEEIVTTLQYQEESFAVDQRFSPNEIPVSRGEIIALSGNSGSSGGPHLHFEIRETDQQRPINVHHLNLPVIDNVPPHIEAICIYPMDEQSTVNGKNEPLYIPAVFHSGRFHLRGNSTIKASGTIGIGIETLDYFTDSWRKCGVYSIQLNVDQQKWFRSQLDGFLFSETRYLNSHIDFQRRRTKSQVIQKSFLDENNQLDIYTTGSHRGVISMKQGQNRQLDYQVRDAAGNESQLNFLIQGVSSPSSSIITAAPEQELIHPNRPWSTHIDGFSVSFPTNSFYTRVPADVSVLSNTGTGIGNHISVLSENIPVHQFFEITIPIPDNYRSHARLTGARINERGQLVYAGGVRRGSNLVIRTRDTGTYCLTIDDTPPSLRLINTPSNRNYKGRQTIRIDIRDDFSGIADYRCTINGQWELFEYDPKNNLLTGFFDKFNLPPGSRHRLEVTATDNVGNETSLKIEFLW